MRLVLGARVRHLILCLVAAVLTGVFVEVYLAGLGARVPVVVAARDLPAHTVLEEGLVKAVLLPKAAVHPGAVRKVPDALGRITLVPRAAGEQLLTATLVEGDASGPFRARLAAEERALFLPSSAAVGGWLGVGRGDFVDLTVALDGAAVCLAQGVEVLEVVFESAAVALRRSEGVPAGVYLRVTPAMAERLVLAVENGKVYVAVEGWGGVPVPSPGVWLDQLYSGGGAFGEVTLP